MTSKEATTDDFQKIAREIVAKWANENTEKRFPNDLDLTMEDILIVSSCKTLQHWKATLFTRYRPDWYFEITFNGDRHEAYLNAYKKDANVCLNLNDYGFR